MRARRWTGIAALACLAGCYTSWATPLASGERLARTGLAQGDAVASGLVAAFGIHRIGNRWTGLAGLARRAPYLSGALIVLVGLYVGWQALSHLP